jgi:ribosome biogenesis GTPase A
MNINWFPGHMHKARKEIGKIIPKIDIIIEILDARAPETTANPLINTFATQTSRLKVLNKADLADPSITNKWLDYFNAQTNVVSVIASNNNLNSTKNLLKILPKQVDKRNFTVRPLTALIAGVPNVGKSTIINTLCGKTIAKTGNEPAVTKAQQRIKVTDNILLVDTPGFLWPKLETSTIACKLAALGSIKNTAFDAIDIAYFLIEYFLLYYPQEIKRRYNLELVGNVEETIDSIAINCGCIKRKSVIDYDKIAIRVINDFRNGKLGLISLESPDTFLIKE